MLGVGRVGLPTPKKPRSPNDEDEMASNAFAGLIGALKGNVSAVLNLIGDSTGDATNDWFYRFLTEDLGPALPGVCIRYRLWSDASQSYGATSTLQAGTAGQRYIALDGSHFAKMLNGTPVARSSADFEVEVKIAPDDWTPSAQKRIVGQLGSAGNRAWFLMLNTTGTLQFGWYADGTNLITSSATPALGFADGTAASIRVRLDVDNGGGGYTLTIDTSTDDGANWTNQLNTVTSSGTTSVFASTADFNAGLVSGTGAWSGKLYDVIIRDGIAGPQRTPASIEAWFDETTPRMSWGGSPTLYVYNGSQPGGTTAYFDDSTRRPKVCPWGPIQLTILSLGHNDVILRAAPGFASSWSTFLTNLKARAPLAAFVACTQNPRYTGQTTGDSSADTMSQVGHGLPLLMQRHGVGVIDTYRAFDLAVAGGASLADLVSDGVHPTAPAGVTVWKNEVWRVASQRLMY